MIQTQKRRLLAKTITYKIMSLISGVLIIGGMTGTWTFATGIALVLLIVNTTLYYLHELIWARFNWGRSDVIS